MFQPQSSSFHLERGISVNLSLSRARDAAVVQRQSHSVALLLLVILI